MTGKNLTRREVLTALLGLPAALAACRYGSQMRIPDGEIIGASDGFGHRLSFGPRISPSPDNWKRVGVVIVGGGIAGLTTAWRFLKAGFTDFELIELEPEPGGVSRSGASSLVPFPW